MIAIAHSTQRRVAIVIEVDVNDSEVRKTSQPQGFVNSRLSSDQTLFAHMRPSAGVGLPW